MSAPRLCSHKFLPVDTPPRCSIQLVKTFGQCRPRREAMQKFSRYATFMLALAPAVWAQSSSSTILGLVRDSSGAVVPSAVVVAVHTETNQNYRAVTTADGYY